jgi:hypothetical protein
MNRLLLSAVSSASVLFLTAGPVGAQLTPNPALGYNPTGRPPTVSPYLNLLRGGNPAANYYNGVRFEFNQRYTNQQFRTTLQELERRENAALPPEEEIEPLPRLPSTGHPTAFNNLGSYFNTSSPLRPTAAPAKGVARPKRTK